MGKGVNDDNITNMVQDMMIAEVPLDSIHIRRSFLPPRISCVGGEGQDNQVHQEEAGNVLDVGVVEGRRYIVLGLFLSGMSWQWREDVESGSGLEWWFGTDGI